MTPNHTNINTKGIDLPNIKWAIQYHVLKELSTWWQRAGHTGRHCSINAVAILLAEPSYFDNEQAKAAEKAVDRAVQQALKHTANGQLQPQLNKWARTSNEGHPVAGGRQTIEATASGNVLNGKISQEMGDFINAENCPAKCRQVVVNSKFGNDDLRK